MAISVLTNSDSPLPGDIWPEVIRLPQEFPAPLALNRTTLRILQMTDYAYQVPARHVTTYLRLIPPSTHGWQTRLSHRLHTAPLPHTTLTQNDLLGNEFWYVQHERIQAHLTFAIELEVRTHCAYSEDGISLPTPIPGRSGESIQMYRETTERTTPTPDFSRIAEEVCHSIGERRPSLQLFAALCDRVHQEMQFDSKATSVQTSAAAAWQMRRGVCQDYSHITLTLCRLCGLAARYVSGFVPGEGVMHAWVEAFLPLRINGRNHEYWFAYDATYNKWVDDNYITIAVGRDYSDITPTSGTYFGGVSIVKYHNKVTIKNKSIHLL